MNCKCNKLYIGLLIGLVLPIVMSLVLYFTLYSGELEYMTFINRMVNMGSIGKLLSISVLPNLVVFLIAIKLERLLAARGLVTATVLYAIVLLVLKYLI